MRIAYPLCSLVLAGAAAFFGGCESQRTFAAPADAVTALSTAVENQDKAELRQLFGPHTAELRSGDPDQDHDDAIIFARRLKEAHELRSDSAKHQTLLIGQDRWPFAVPLVKDSAGWRFDTEEGLDELENRRIGRNELRTIEACRTLIAAQEEFQMRQADRCFADRLMSTPGSKDGLYWDSPGGVDPSPIGPVMAMAASRTNERGERLPFNGYLFKPLRQQGEAGPGGAMDFRVNSKLMKGWAVLAYPAEYGHTGVISFLVSGAGQIYQRDLGEDTDAAVKATQSFNPTKEWTPVAN